MYSNQTGKKKPRHLLFPVNPFQVNKSVELGSMSSMSTLRTSMKSPTGMKIRDPSRTSLKHESTILPQLVDVNKRKGGDGDDRS